MDLLLPNVRSMEGGEEQVVARGLVLPTGPDAAKKIYVYILDYLYIYSCIWLDPVGGNCHILHAQSNQLCKRNLWKPKHL